MDQFDFVCINLVSRPDRRAMAEKLFSELGIPIQWWIVEKHPQGGMYGCFESHWLVWNSKEFTKPYLCVFEDDLEMLPGSKERFVQALQYATQYLGPKFDMLNLEPGQGYATREIAPELFEASFYHLGCYILSRESISEISEKVIQWFGIDIDTALYRNCRMGAMLPPIFRQAVTGSDNGGGYREIPLPLEKSFNWMISLKRLSPWIGWWGLELSQLLAVYYLYTKDRSIEFQNRRVENRSLR